jgi:hypothetical protein
MHQNKYPRAGILAVALTIVALVSYELYLRFHYKDLKISYDDNSALWADKRAMVYEPRDRATVFIGPSRIKFDLDIPTWQAKTGEQAIQLAVVGQSDWDSFDDLANDKNFKGKLIVDVMTPWFCTKDINDGWTIRGYIDYYHKITPTQRASFPINHLLESGLIFLNQDNFSFNALLSKLNIPQRKNVWSMPVFPVGFTPVTFDRQSYMTPGFVADTSQRNQVKNVWTGGDTSWSPPPIPEDSLRKILNSAKVNVDKIRSRGGEVIFIRMPSSGQVLKKELQWAPRKIYWDRLLSVTGCKGIYFLDYPAIAHFECPEWSHLSPAQAVIFTNNLIKILREEKGWTFIKKPV